MVSFSSLPAGVPQFAGREPQRRPSDAASVSPSVQQPAFGRAFSSRKTVVPGLLFILALLSAPFLPRTLARANDSQLTADAYRNAIVSASPDALGDGFFDSAELQATLNDPDTPDAQLEALGKMDYFVRTERRKLGERDLRLLEEAGNGEITAAVVDNLPDILDWPDAVVPIPPLAAEDFINSIVSAVPVALVDEKIDSAELQRTINDPDTPEEQKEPLRKMDHFLRNTEGHETLTVADLEALEAAGNGQITPDVVDNLPEILGWPAPPCDIYMPFLADGSPDLSAEGFIKVLVWANNEAMVDERIDSAELQAALNHPDTPEMFGAFVEQLGKLDWHLRNNEGGHTFYTRDDLYALQEAGNGSITAEVADRLPEILNW